jgi:hypothetical protein
MTDSDGNNPATLIALYDRNKTSGGVSYTVSGSDKWIEYKYPIKNLIDRVVTWVSASLNCYFAYTEDYVTWNYLKAEADHTLTDQNELLAASNQADAQTNYWTMASSGKNTSIWPQQIVAKAVRMYLIGNFTRTIYEMVPFREIIAEYIVTDELSAISANVGTLTSGIIQSADFANGGVLIDLDADQILVKDSSGTTRVLIGKLS